MEPGSDIRELIADEIDVVGGALKEAEKAQAEAQRLEKEAGSAATWKGFGPANAIT